MLVCALLVYSSSPSSLPTRPGFTCASQDISCWKEQVLWYDRQLGLLVDLTKMEREKSSVLSAINGQLRKGYDDANNLADKLGSQAIKAGERSWTESPALWSSVTAIVMGALAIGIAQGFKVSLNGR